MSIDSRSAELECTLLELLKQQPTADVAETELDPESDCELTTTDESASEEDNTTVDPRLVRLHGSWWKGEPGVVDVRRWGPGADATSGLVFTHCAYTIGRIVGSAGGQGTTTFKVGIAHEPHRRWENYLASDEEMFTHMFLLHRTKSREGADYL